MARLLHLGRHLTSLRVLRLLAARRVVSVVVISAALLAASSGPLTRADPDPDPGLVCSMYRMGDSPGQIADRLRQNDARLRLPQLPLRVFQDLQDCG